MLVHRGLINRGLTVKKVREKSKKGGCRRDPRHAETRHIAFAGHAHLVRRRIYTWQHLPGIAIEVLTFAPKVSCRMRSISVNHRSWLGGISSMTSQPSLLSVCKARRIILKPDPTACSPSSMIRSNPATRNCPGKARKLLRSSWSAQAVEIRPARSRKRTLSPDISRSTSAPKILACASGGFYFFRGT